MLRVFIGLRLPDAVLDVLEDWGERELTGGRRVGRDDLHVTLAFLGSRPAHELAGILDVLRTVGGRHAPFPLEPRLWRETRTVGMLVLSDPTTAGAELAADLQRSLEELGVFRAERRPWLPHVTVQRHRAPTGLRPTPPPMGTFVPSDAAAYLSHLHPSGARYEIVETVALRRDDRTTH